MATLSRFDMMRLQRKGGTLGAYLSNLRLLKVAGFQDPSEATSPTNCRVTAKLWTEGSGVSKTEVLPLFMKPLSGWWSFGPDTRSLS